MNPHSVLGVASSATPEEIKSAYRKLAMKHHPDRNGGSDDALRKFQEIQDAYDILRADKPKTQQSHHEEQMHRNMHDMFHDFFNRQHMGNPNLQAVCGITLEQAFNGCTVNFNVNGKAITVNLPAGIDQGQTVRVPGAAGQPNPNYPAGDLHVVIQLQPHERFHRHGMTLLTRVQIDLLDLVTGCEIEVVGITGDKKTVKIPENSNPQSSVSIVGEGMPVVNSDDRGDLIVHFDVQFPTFTKKQLASLRKLKPKS